jgi:hypothetical protein
LFFAITPILGRVGRGIPNSYTDETDHTWSVKNSDTNHLRVSITPRINWQADEFSSWLCWYSLDREKILYYRVELNFKIRGLCSRNSLPPPRPLLVLWKPEHSHRGCLTHASPLMSKNDLLSSSRNSYPYKKERGKK